MRYWAYFTAKLGLSAACLYGLLRVVNIVWPPEPQFFGYAPPYFGYDLRYTTALLVWFLLCAGAVYLCIWDQRYRCRVSLRRRSSDFITFNTNNPGIPVA